MGHHSIAAERNRHPGKAISQEAHQRTRSRPEGACHRQAGRRARRGRREEVEAPQGTLQPPAGDTAPPRCAPQSPLAAVRVRPRSAAPCRRWQRARSSRSRPPTTTPCASGTLTERHAGPERRHPGPPKVPGTWRPRRPRTSAPSKHHRPSAQPQTPGPPRCLAPIPFVFFCARAALGRGTRVRLAACRPRPRPTLDRAAARAARAAAQVRGESRAAPRGCGAGRTGTSTLAAAGSEAQERERKSAAQGADTETPGRARGPGKAAAAAASTS
jgi:hypothetical protein